MKELPKIYDPRSVEKRIYQMWMDGGWFRGVIDPEKEPFTIVIPPPNVTGQLHLGHAFDETLQDVLIRFKRMQGCSALWVPGTDHAGIATQIKVEEELRKEGISPLRPRPRKIPGAGLGLEKHLREQDRRATEDAWLFLRLGQGALHHGRGLLQGRPRSVCLAV